MALELPNLSALSIEAVTVCGWAYSREATMPESWPKSRIEIEAKNPEPETHYRLLLESETEPDPDEDGKERHSLHVHLALQRTFAEFHGVV